MGEFTEIQRKALSKWQDGKPHLPSQVRVTMRLAAKLIIAGYLSGNRITEAGREALAARPQEKE